MKFREIRGALAALLLPLVQGAEVMRPDDKKPLKRPSFKIDVLPVSGGAACAGARERELDVDIWYYPRDSARPRDEIDEVIYKLLGALDGGFAAGGVWLLPDEEAVCHADKDVLVIQFSVSWVESAGEDGEPMETLRYDGEELTD